MRSRQPIPSRLLTALCALFVSACSATVPPVVATPIPTATPIRVSLTGRPLVADQKNVFRLMEDGTLRHILDQKTYSALAYQPNDLITVAPPQLHAYPSALPLTRWITGQIDHTLYFLQNGKRYKILDAATLTMTVGSVTDVSVVSDSYLNSFPETDQPIDGIASLIKPPSTSSAVWAQGALWLARGDQPLLIWNPASHPSASLTIPNRPQITALSVSNDQPLTGTNSGSLSRFDTP